MERIRKYFKLIFATEDEKRSRKKIAEMSISVEMVLFLNGSLELSEEVTSASGIIMSFPVLILILVFLICDSFSVVVSKKKSNSNIANVYEN